jgi:Pyruvate/2-oxoacid:ferredoxin oxidoreductase gamma subunit
MVDRSVARTDVRVVAIDATDEAAALDKPTVSNMVLLGALLKILPVVSIGAVRQALVEHFPPSRQDLIEVNAAAVKRGWSSGSQLAA